MNYEALIERLETDPNTIILTPNRRLSATLLKKFHEVKINQNKQCWETPQILPLNSWMLKLWNDLISQTFDSHPLVLNAQQEEFLWEKILLRSHKNETLLQISETAKLARAACTLLKQWEIDPKHPYFKETETTQIYLTWLQEFESICKQNHWIDHASLPNLLIEKVLSKTLSVSSSLMLVGFTEVSPQIKRFLSLCNSQSITWVFSSEKISEAYQLELNDQENEILSIARWAKSHYVNNKNLKLGCVFPSLDKIRDRVWQIFTEVFADEQIAHTSSPFNISAGKSLAHYSIVHTALQLLSLHTKKISRETFSQLLNSPFLGESLSENISRIKFDCFLRQQNISKITLNFSTTENIFLSYLKKYSPQFSKRLEEFYSLLPHANKTLSHHAWAGLFNRLLAILGWPGERSLNSEEYQIVDAWLNLLNEFSTLDEVAYEVNFTNALQTLMKLAHKTIFQTKTPDAPIQVLGLLEAASLPFDYLWIAEMNDISWPPQPKPNPFIPKRLQRELNMPHATAERELAFCKQMTEQFKQSADQIIFSYGKKNENIELEASSLINDLPKLPQEKLNLAPFVKISQRIFDTKSIEHIIDEKGPSYHTEETVCGGINVIKQQALCPFKSFAEWRLHAHELETSLPGLRHKDRGNLVHKVLELIWKQLIDHETLVSMNEDQLNFLIDESIQQACQPLSQSLESQQYLRLEKFRMHKMIRTWLALEKKRKPFKVLMNEKSATIQLNQLKLSVRIDRIDELPDGKKLIIDYKTGKNNDINNWFSERIDEPQLPLYTLLDPLNTVGITFAELFPGDQGFRGVSQYEMDIPGIKLLSEIKKSEKIEWSEQINSWNQILLKLSDDFYHGIAKVDPKKNETCTWCSLKSLCRVNEKITQSIISENKFENMINIQNDSECIYE